MRIVLDARYAGPRPSGIGNYVRSLASRLPALAPDLGFRFWVPPDAPPFRPAPNTQAHRVRQRASGLATLLRPSALDRLSEGDLFHGPANVLGFGLPCPAVVTVHDVMWLEHLAWCQPNVWLRPISKRYYETGIYRALRHAERLLTVSQASADDLVRLERSAHGRVVVTPNACEPHFRAPESRDGARRDASRHLGFDAPFFLVVGQNMPSKGHPIAVRAFAAANLLDHRLVLVQRLAAGVGLHRLVRDLGIEGRVHFAEGLSEAALVALFQSATALIQPSYGEGFGLPALEAMASGCPVIASDIAALAEVLGGAGALAAPGSVGGFRDAMSSLATDPVRREEQRARGLERARAFSWDRTAALTLEVYRDVMTGRSRRD